jgi:hypothetical protein
MGAYIHNVLHKLWNKKSDIINKNLNGAFLFPISTHYFQFVHEGHVLVERFLLYVTIINLQSEWVGLSTDASSLCSEGALRLG